MLTSCSSIKGIISSGLDTLQVTTLPPFDNVPIIPGQQSANLWLIGKAAKYTVSSFISVTFASSFAKYINSQCLLGISFGKPVVPPDNKNIAVSLYSNSSTNLFFLFCLKVHNFSYFSVSPIK